MNKLIQNLVTISGEEKKKEKPKGTMPQGSSSLVNKKNQTTKGIMSMPYVIFTHFINLFSYFPWTCFICFLSEASA